LPSFREEGEDEKSNLGHPSVPVDPGPNRVYGVGIGLSLPEVAQGAAWPDTVGHRPALSHHGQLYRQSQPYQEQEAHLQRTVAVHSQEVQEATASAQEVQCLVQGETWGLDVQDRTPPQRPDAVRRQLERHPQSQLDLQWPVDLYPLQV
jgi:hypothetical protein